MIDNTTITSPIGEIVWPVSLATKNVKRAMQRPRTKDGKNLNLSYDFNQGFNLKDEETRQFVDTLEQARAALADSVDEVREIFRPRKKYILTEEGSLQMDASGKPELKELEGEVVLQVQFNKNIPILGEKGVELTGNEKNLPRGSRIRVEYDIGTNVFNSRDGLLVGEIRLYPKVIHVISRPEQTPSTPRRKPT